MFQCCRLGFGGSLILSHWREREREGGILCARVRQTLYLYRLSHLLMSAPQTSWISIWTKTTIQVISVGYETTTLPVHDGKYWLQCVPAMLIHPNQSNSLVTYVTTVDLAFLYEISHAHMRSLQYFFGHRWQRKIPHPCYILSHIDWSIRGPWGPRIKVDSSSRAVPTIAFCSSLLTVGVFSTLCQLVFGC